MSKTEKVVVGAVAAAAVVTVLVLVLRHTAGATAGAVAANARRKTSIGGADVQGVKGTAQTTPSTAPNTLGYPNPSADLTFTLDANGNAV